MSRGRYWKNCADWSFVTRTVKVVTRMPNSCNYNSFLERSHCLTHISTNNMEMCMFLCHYIYRFAITFIVLISFSVLGTLTVTRIDRFVVIDWVISKPFLALAGVLSTLLAIISAIGLGLLTNIVFIDMATVMPFLVMCKLMLCQIWSWLLTYILALNQNIWNDFLTFYWVHKTLFFQLSVSTICFWLRQLGERLIALLQYRIEWRSRCDMPAFLLRWLLQPMLSPSLLAQSLHFLPWASFLSMRSYLVICSKHTLRIC